MSLEVTGKLHEVFPTQQIKENFSKREFVLELTDESPSGMVFTNYASFQLVNNSCSVIDQFQTGEMLKVNFNIRGNRWERDGNVKYITNLNAWRVERAGAATPNMPQQNYNNQQQQAPASYQQPGNNTNTEDSDLPF
jgi:hypothetical protein